MLHQITDNGRDTVVVATVKTALSLIDKKFSTEIEKMIYAIKKIQPRVEIFEQLSLFLKWHVSPCSTTRYSSAGDNPWNRKNTTPFIGMKS